MGFVDFYVSWGDRSDFHVRVFRDREGAANYQGRLFDVYLAPVFGSDGVYVELRFCEFCNRFKASLLGFVRCSYVVVLVWG